MNWLLLLYKLLFATVLLDAVASSIAAGFLFRLRLAFAKYLAKAFLANGLESWAAILAAGVSPSPARIVIWLTVLRILTRLYKTVANVKVALFLLGYINGDHPKVVRGQDDAE